MLFLLADLPVVALAQAGDLESQCAAVSSSTSGCPGLNEADCKVLLKKCSDYYDQLSSQLEMDLTKTSQQKNTLASQIAGLKNKISGLEAQINQSTVMVKDLNLQIADTEDSIDKTSSDITDSENQVKNILRAVYQEDQKPSFMILLEGDLSDFFSNIAYLEGLNSKVSGLLQSTKDLKTYLENQQVKMTGNVDQLQKTIAWQTLQKKENEQAKKEQDTYLKLTETQYQKQLADKQAVEQKSAKIKAMLFQVVGVSKAPTFGEAIEVAKVAANMVGIRPAFLLAVISQESALGRNVGQCYLVDPVTGAGKKISTGASVIHIMKPSRDVPPFIAITTALGKNPYTTPVSCWIPSYVKGQPYGWGGAMGPAQFIASTWNIYAGRLQNLLGRTADPWVFSDAVTASGLYLSELGAKGQTTATESSAASRYYGGSSSYARSVLNRATCIQSFIDSGAFSSYCQSLILGT